MPGIGTGLARRGTIGRPGTRMLERAGAPVGPRPFPTGRPTTPPGLVRPGGRMGRTGKRGREIFLGGRDGRGAPGIARDGRGRALAGLGVPGGGLSDAGGGLSDAGGGLGGAGGGLGGAGRRDGMEGAGGGAARCAACIGGAIRGAGRTDGTCGLGNEGDGPPWGSFGVFGLGGGALTAGRTARRGGFTTGKGLVSRLPLPSTGRLTGTFVIRCLDSAGRLDFPGKGGATLGVGGGVETPGGRDGTMGRTGVDRATTGGRNGPTGGRNVLPAPVTGIDGRTDAPEVRVFRRILRLRMDLRFGKGNSSSGIGSGGAACLRSLILSRTLSAVASSNELEWDLRSLMPRPGSTSMISLDLTSNSRASSLIRIVLLLVALFAARAARYRLSARRRSTPVMPRLLEASI